MRKITKEDTKEDEINKEVDEFLLHCDPNNSGFIIEENLIKAIKDGKVYFNFHLSQELPKINQKLESNVLLHRISSSNTIGKMSQKQLDEHFKMKLYDEIEDQMNTGDILLFRGIEGFSKLIKISSICNFSHVMMVVREPSEKIKEKYGIQDEKEKIFVFESDSEIEQREGGGVQLVGFRKWVKATEHYYHENKDTLLVWRKIVDFDWKSREKEFEEFALEMCGKLYEKSLTQLSGSVFGWNKKEDLETIFCSELIAASYIKAFNLLGNEKKANNFVPRDFTSTQTVDGKDILLKGKARLLPEVRIRLEKPEYKEDKLKQ